VSRSDISVWAIIKIGVIIANSLFSELDSNR